MKKFLIILINLLAISLPTVYHLLGGNNIWISILICNVSFSFADYLTYNWSIDKNVKWCGDNDPNNNLYEPYRIIQYVLGIGLAIQLFIYFGWLAVLAFAVWHFTFNNDMLFYLWVAIFDFYKNGRNAFNNEILDGKCGWAFFTFPIGIYYWIKTGNNRTKIKGSLLCFQSLIGIILTILITFYIK